MTLTIKFSDEEAEAIQAKGGTHSETKRRGKKILGV